VRKEKGVYITQKYFGTGKEKVVSISTKGSIPKHQLLCFRYMVWTLAMYGKWMLL
jgi:hypothetical protein